VGATTDALNRLMLASTTYSPQDVVLSMAGGVVPLLTYLEVKGIDAAPIPEPLRSMVSAKYKTVAVATDVLPPMADVVGVTPSAARRDKAAFIRGVLKARRQAIEYMHANPGDAAAIIAPVYKADPAVIERVLLDTIASERAKGEPYWDAAGIVRPDLIRQAIAGPAATLAGGDAAASDPNLARLIDDTFLADSARPASEQQ
jgi:NitT/TauT family transport system substrate-binding protein